MGNERIYMSVTELAERIKWICLETDRARLVKHWTSLLDSLRENGKSDVQSMTAGN